MPSLSVYVLISGYPDEGYKKPLGAYSSKDLARAADAMLPHEDSPGEYREIIELQLDAAAAYPAS